MSNRVAYSPKYETKGIFLQAQQGVEFLFDYFFERRMKPDGVSEEDYMKELKEEYYKLQREEARRLLGLDNK